MPEIVPVEDLPKTNFMLPFLFHVMESLYTELHKQIVYAFHNLILHLAYYFCDIYEINEPTRS